MAADDFLIVGLGASAGGIKAFRTFFEHVPPNSGLAYVVILHLSPEYESRLPEVLQRSTSIPVMQVTGRVPVEPNRVYVLPPNQSLAMVDGHLEASTITRIEERRAPIDIFFRTLADCQGARAASIVLSGTGADGSMGMKRVKEHGGVCFVQDPREAEHEDMPLHSIATGLADYVLPVAEMPAKLLAYRAHRTALPHLAERLEQPLADAAAMRDIFTHLRVRTGHDFSSYKPGTVLRRLERRMRVGGISTLTEYAGFLRESEDEPQALLKDLLISVTNFFRDAEAFETLDRLVMPKLLEGKGPDDQIRAWVAGCATGEEAYSIAMLLAEHTWGIAEAPAVLLFATDIDTEAIATAREGFYTATDTADVSADRLARFFIEEHGGYRVRKELRSLVLFANHNVIKDPPFSHLDLVSCRNLLIYLNRTMQRRVMDVLHFALDPARYLFLGISESMDGAGDLFVAIDRDAHLFESRSIVARIALPIPEISRQSVLGRGADAVRLTDARRADRLSSADLHQELLEQYSPPSVVVDEDYEILHLSARAGRYLRFSGGEPTRNLLRTIRPELRLELRTALYQATQQRISVEAHGLSLRIDDAPQTLTITVKPVLRPGDPARGFFLVFFEEGRPTETAAAPLSELVAPATAAAHQLEEELQGVKEQLHSKTEQYEAQTEELKVSNEELQAINEELRSSAEELETSKEELQSINEELTTVNQELQIKIEEQSQSHNDILNLVNSTEIGTLFIDRESRIKLFTPSVRRVFSLIPSDLGRPLSDIASRLDNADLTADIARVLERVEPVEREVRAGARWYAMRVIPYRTAEDRIDGVVLTFVDITPRKAAEQELRESVDRLRMAAGAAGMYSWELDLGSQTFKYYTNVERVLGFELPTAAAEAVQFVHPDDRATASDALEKAIRSGGEFTFEQRFVTPSRESVWTRTSGLVLRDAGGQPGRVVGTTQNIDDSKRHEEMLRSTHNQLELRVEERTRELASANAALGLEIDERRAGEDRVKGLLKRLVTVQEDERRRIARDLHDHLGQQMTALRLNLESLKTTPDATDRLRERVEQTDRIAERLDADVEFLAWELRPAGLDDIGLPGTLSKFLREWSNHCGIVAELHVSGLDDQRLGPEIETSLYRIAQEALNNVYKHARADRADVLLERRDDQIILIVEDDGVGFDPTAAVQRGGDRGLGVIGMHERAALAGGTLDIESEVGTGTTIFVRVPLTEIGGLARETPEA
jgi:two-component system, chemotaxis family, CheB/CheR fusion protein